MPKLSDAEIAAGLARLPGWTRKGDVIFKPYTFGKFADGIRFVDRVAVAADAADHHPDIDIRFTTVTMRLSTHSEGGVTAKDVKMAGEIERLAKG